MEEEEYLVDKNFDGFVSVLERSYNDISESPFGSDGVLASVFCLLKKTLKCFSLELCESKKFLKFVSEFNKIKTPYEDYLGVMKFFEYYPDKMNDFYSFLNKSERYKDSDTKKFIEQIQTYVKLYNIKKSQEKCKNLKKYSVMDNVEKNLNNAYNIAKGDLWEKRGNEFKRNLSNAFDILVDYAKLDVDRQEKLDKMGKRNIKKGLASWYEKYKNTNIKDPKKIQEAILSINNFQFKFFSGRSRLGKLKNIVKKLNSVLRNKN